MKIAVYGLQWGDEGKGKVVSFLSPKFEWIVRYSGGPNAGHTIVEAGQKIIHHHLPCIDHHGSNKGYLGPGMVIDLNNLLKEIKNLEAIFPGIPRRIYVDRYAPLILPWHKREEELFEKEEKIGTTKRGIGPAYKDKTARFAVTISDILEDTALEKLQVLHKLLSRYIGDLEPPEAIFKSLKAALFEIVDLGVKITDYVSMKKTLENSSVLFEGSQGFLLDINCGTYPYVTSGQVCLAGITAYFAWVKIDSFIGVAKAYTTRVGEGPFPTEISGDLADVIRQQGGEYGATTGRPRRIGWLDLPALRYAVMLAPANEIVLTKADVLSGLETIKVAVAYEVEGKKLDIPRGYFDFFKAHPIYVTLPGWKSLSDPQFERFITFIEKETGVKISGISTGPETKSMIER